MYHLTNLTVKDITLIIDLIRDKKDALSVQQFRQYEPLVKAINKLIKQVKDLEAAKKKPINKSFEDKTYGE